VGDLYLPAVPKAQDVQGWVIENMRITIGLDLWLIHWETGNMKIKAWIAYLLLVVIMLAGCAPASTPVPATPTDEVIVPATPTSQPTSLPTLVPGDYPGPLGDRVVFTYYFYWYDHVTGEHMDQQTHRPVPEPAVTWRGTEWHRRQVEDMLEAGIDVILPVFWSTEGTAWWARPGLENLVLALEEVRLSGKTPPSIAMMYDTNAHLYEKVDFLTIAVRQIMYADIRYFFTAVPREYWALTQDGRPMIWFWAAYPLGDYDENLLVDIANWFEADFGVRPFIVADSDWVWRGIPAAYDATSIWIEAGSGSTAQVTTVSPGVDDRIIEHYTSHSVVDRENGNVYRNGWTKAMLCGTPWVAVESWNEYHEATEVAETVELGRQYIELTGEYSDYFKQGILPPQGLISGYKEAGQVSAKLGENNIQAGLVMELQEEGEGATRPDQWAGEAGRVTLPDAPYMYFNVDDGYYFNIPTAVEITIRYFDQGQGTIYIEYDTAACASDWQAESMYKQVPIVTLTNTGTWRTASITLTDATFAGHQNGFNDFRVANYEAPLILNEVSISKLP